jgi:hypothetical protein
LCRKEGYLPIDFVAQDISREFNNLEDLTEEYKKPIDYLNEWLDYVKKIGERKKDVSFWESQKYYVQMMVEKLDVRNLFTDICKKYHIPISNCFDSKTEILTEMGWKKFTDLTYNDGIATMDKQEKLIYQKPIRIIKEAYNGEMYSIKNRSLDMLITPNHRVYIKRQRNNPKNLRFSFEHIKNVFKLQNIKFKRDFIWNGDNPKYFILPSVETRGKSHYTKEPTKHNIEKWLQFLGYYISEGSCKFSDKNSHYRVQLAQRKKAHPENYRKMIDCIEKLGFSSYYYCDDNQIEVSSKQLYSYLKSLGKAWEKYIPREFLKLSPRLSRILLIALAETDGHIRGKGMVCTTTSKQLADDIQELSLKAGYVANISINFRGMTHPSKIGDRLIFAKHPIYRININSTNREPRINHGKKDWEIINYKGSIHCVEIPNGIIMVRRNGKQAWSGNSKGWSDMLSRNELVQRFKKAEEIGLIPVLLYYGDFDPAGIKIAETLKKNIIDLKNATKWNPDNLIIDHFGLTIDFIEDNDILWIDNLITGGKRNLGKLYNQYKEGKENIKLFDYEIKYIEKYGVKKCEANAILPIKEIAIEDCEKTIQKYLGLNPFETYDKKLKKNQKEVTDLMGRVDFKEKIQELIDDIEKENQDSN